MRLADDEVELLREPSSPGHLLQHFAATVLHNTGALMTGRTDLFVAHVLRMFGLVRPSARSTLEGDAAAANDFPRSAAAPGTCVPTARLLSDVQHRHNVLLLVSLPPDLDSSALSLCKGVVPTGLAAQQRNVPARPLPRAAFRERAPLRCQITANAIVGRNTGRGGRVLAEATARGGRSGAARERAGSRGVCSF